MNKYNHNREILCKARRIVVKAGSKVLVQRSGRPDRIRMEKLVDEITQIQKKVLKVLLFPLVRLEQV